MITYKASEDGILFDYPDIPIMDGPDGIKFDFLNGLRIQLPKTGGNRHVTFCDADTGTVLFDQMCVPGSQVRSSKSYYIKFQIKISDAETGSLIWEHTLDLENKPVMILMPVATIGDTMAWFPYVELFRQKHGCNITCVMKEKFSVLFEKQYQLIRFVTPEKLPEVQPPYACYMLGLWWKGNTTNQPFDHRLTSLHKQAAYILGLDAKHEYKPRFDLSASRKIKESYVCVAVQATTMCKNWLNPFGWEQVINFLKGNGYRVLCIDRDEIQGIAGVYNRMPQGVENFTGDLPLQERIDLLKDADFFIGLPSGLSWLAWGCDIPVVMISGFSLPYTEFYTPYRVINFNSCVGCWNDVRHDFDHHDWLWCPRHKGTERQYECSVLISAQQVIETITRIPAFQEHQIHAS